ncbi:MAG TPA: NfeD family protein [Gemmatimonadales bacterium]|nr:NfeD family protein [Gemmatimonadales bacterium]
MAAWQLWSVIAVLLLIAEMFTGGFWLACVAVGAAAAAVAALLPFAGMLTQTIVFAAGSLLGLIGLRPALTRRFLHSGGRELRSGVDALRGKSGYVTERIEPGSRPGRVNVEGEDWRGVSLDDSVLEPGTRVMVIQVDGTTLIVEKEG